MPRNLRRLSDHFNTQIPNNKTSNGPQSPWFPFIYGSQTHQDQNSHDNVDSDQGSVSTDISHNSSLQSKNGIHKRKGDDVVYNSPENNPHNTQNVKSHIEIPTSQPILPNNPFAFVKFPIPSEIDKHQNSCGDTDSGQGAVSNDTSQNSMVQSKNAAHKRKSNAVLHNSMENYPHNTWNANSHIQIATTQPVLSTNGSASMKFPVVTQEIDRCQNSNANLDSTEASISSNTSQNSSVQSRNRGHTEKIPDLTDNNSHSKETTNQTINQYLEASGIDHSEAIHYPNPPSNVSHQQHIYEDRFPKRLRKQSRQTVTSQRRTGGATYNVRNRLRANNLLKSFASSPTPGVEQSTLQTNADTTSSYEDLGDCDQRCQHCGAAFWYEERVKRNSTNTRTEYHLCCSQGRFIMDYEADPPQYSLRNA